jgi:hypothetical protein
MTAFLIVRSTIEEDPVYAAKPEPIAAPLLVTTLKKPSTIVRFVTFEKPDRELYPEPIPEPDKPLTLNTPPLIVKVPTVVAPVPKLYPDPIPEPYEQEAVMLLFVMLRFVTVELPELTEPEPMAEPLEPSTANEPPKREIRPTSDLPSSENPEPIPAPKPELTIENRPPCISIESRKESPDELLSPEPTPVPPEIANDPFRIVRS